MHATQRIPPPAEPAPVIGFPSTGPGAAYEAILRHVGASTEVWSALCAVARAIEALGFRANLLALATTLETAADASARTARADDARDIGDLALQAAELQRQCAVAARQLHAAVLDSSADAHMGNVPGEHARVSLESAIGLAQRLASIVDETSATCAALHRAARCTTHAAMAAGATASRTLDELAATIDDAVERLASTDAHGAVARLRRSR